MSPMPREVERVIPHDFNDSNPLRPQPQTNSHHVNVMKDLPDLPSPPPTPIPTPTPPVQQLKPSVRLLFSHLTSRQRLCFLLPAIASSVIAGGVAPFMTLVVGQVFDAFSQFTTSPSTRESRQRLIRDVGVSGIQLIGLGVGILSLSSIISSLWIRTGEGNVTAVRKWFYRRISQKDMSWFDTKIGAEELEHSTEVQQSVSAAGLMSNFMRETDDIRAASSLASGLLVQYLTTCITGLILAFMRSWALSLVILSVVPSLVIITIISQTMAGPLMIKEQGQISYLGTLISRAVSSISTVKAFNAEGHEESAFVSALEALKVTDYKLTAAWGMSSGLTQFATMAMFIQGFWFGAKLVREGHISAGDVMAVFWACLIATNNLQMCIPQFITLAKGKFAILSLYNATEESAPANFSIPKHLLSQPRWSSSLRKIIPDRCTGELAMHNVSFHYPSRPSVPVLDDVSMYLPAGEMTFIVGGSGSGKSTISQMLLGIYTPQKGAINLDDQDMAFLDRTWLRDNVAAVSQTCHIFDGSAHDNVAVAVSGSRKYPTRIDVPRQDVIEACTSALIHDFIKDLPDGYNTRLGEHGANLSGGQKQRISIARARIRNPPVLILDEATSALDPTSRALVFDAIKHWRASKTTIVITHDLSQIEPGDFVYVLKSGQVVEQGYRYDLEAADGEFNSMTIAQGLTGGCLPTKNLDRVEEDALPLQSEETLSRYPSRRTLGFTLTRRASLAQTFSNWQNNWMLNAVADLTNSRRETMDGRQTLNVASKRPSTPGLKHSASAEPLRQPVIPDSGRLRRSSSAFISHSTSDSDREGIKPAPKTIRPVPSTNSFDQEKRVMQQSGYQASKVRNARGKRVRLETPIKELSPLPTVDEIVEQPRLKRNFLKSFMPLRLLNLFREVFPTIPNKPLLYFGCIICVLSGALTPVFSFVLSRVLFEVSIGAQNNSTIDIFGGIVLALAALDGIFIGLKYSLMELSGIHWIMNLRKTCFHRILLQHKKWFDRSENSTIRMVQILVKGGGDAQNLIAAVLAQSIVVLTMLLVGTLWALIRGWQLTLVGMAIGPIFAGLMAWQSRLVFKCEVKNKQAREEVGKRFYETIYNIRSIRAMGLEYVLRQEFETTVDKAHTICVRGSFIEGVSYGLSNGLIYFAEAVLFFVGATLISRGTYTYLQMVEVLNLVVFTVTIASQLLAFTQKIAKSVEAATEFMNLSHISEDTEESRGALMPPISGNVLFKDVNFSYPERPDVPVLKNFNLEISDGECVAIVGSSGSGKTTVASLIQRLYEPNNGLIYAGLNQLSTLNIRHLRHNISVVSQQPHLHDTSIYDNIIYGGKMIFRGEVYAAAQAAKAHDFISSLPKGYDTIIGDNASQLSGGQAQRLQIARALVRPSRILILDECTSALDPETEAGVLQSLLRSGFRTTIMITHKLPVMRLCDRIVLLDKGRVAEQGTFDQLMAKKGLFASLARGGEWIA